MSKLYKLFSKNKNQIKNSKISDPFPRIIILQGIGYLSMKASFLNISNDIFLSMKQSILIAFKSINQKDIFKMEYWPLERAKLDNKKRNI